MSRTSKTIGSKLDRHHHRRVELRYRLAMSRRAEVRSRLRSELIWVDHRLVELYRNRVRTLAHDLCQARDGQVRERVRADLAGVADRILILSAEMSGLAAAS